MNFLQDSQFEESSIEKSQINADLFADFSFADEHETEQSIDLGGMSISFGKTSDTHKDMNTEFQQDGPECISLRFENENLRAEKCELQAKIDAIKQYVNVKEIGDKRIEMKLKKRMKG
ncbi:MAG: hypothetical protein EZS28_003053 [Streblomastix strix]|uniref:Uncharacterized protein n=1 Tax=Streblomastix strix TaxID=222440 RepID=A0A5J4X4H3_9EUKA|nr:MAG: hypothetical protein EZS28_003053 [Streblomastix strix]